VEHAIRAMRRCEQDDHTIVGEPRQQAGRDPLVLALARYVEALDRRYPDGPAQMRREALASRANIVAMPPAEGPRA
jgi:hypothetical protein